MNYKNLIERLKYYGTTYAIGDNLGKEIDGSDELMLNAATALSTIQAENEKLRETVDKYATAARAIALNLKPFCDESLPYDEMIADAARKASDEMERVKREMDATVEGLRVCSIENNMECQYCLYRTARSFCWNCADGSNWKFRGQKED